MRYFVVFTLAVAATLSGCGAAAVASVPARTLPDPLVATSLPDRPDTEEIPPEEDWALSVDDYEVAPGDRRSGVLLSDAKARRAARFRVSYDELRALYEVDIRTWGRERDIFEHALTDADAEVARLRVAAQRSFWEQNDGTIGLVVGLILGAAVVSGAAAVVAEIHP